VFWNAVNALLLVLVDDTVGHALEPVVLSATVACSTASNDESTSNVVLRVAGSNIGVLCWPFGCGNFLGDAVNALCLVLVDDTVGHALEPVVLSTAITSSTAGSDKSASNVVLGMAGSDVLRRWHSQG